VPPLPAARKVFHLEPGSQAELAFLDLDFFVLAGGDFAAGPAVGRDFWRLLAIVLIQQQVMFGFVVLMNGDGCRFG
jgi:hypothetical protein